jgi:hypothetical protein
MLNAGCNSKQKCRLARGSVLEEKVVVLLPKEVPDFGFLLMLKEERLELKG